MTDKILKTKQLYFFLMPEESKEVLEFIVEQKCIIYLDRSITPVPCESECHSLTATGQVFFCPQEVAKNIEMQKSAGGIYFLDPTTSPVVEFGCPILHDNGLSRGRIYFRGGHMGRDEWVPFPEILYESFKMVSSFMKKSFLTKERVYDAYVSKGSQVYVSKGGKLVQF